MDLKAYAEWAGKKYTTLYDKMKAWRVMSVTHVRNEAIRDAWSQLATIHSAPQWLWSGLVKAMLEGSWTVQATRDKVGAVKEVAPPAARSDLR